MTFCVANHEQRVPSPLFRRRGWPGTQRFSRGPASAAKTNAGPLSYGNSPNTATPVCVPTNTLPLAIMGVMNLLPAPNWSRDPA